MTTAVVEARSLLVDFGYDAAAIDLNYPVWLGPQYGVDTADLVAFSQPAPKDMSTAVVTMSKGSIERGYRLASALAAPYFLVEHKPQLDVWVADPSGPRQLLANIREIGLEEVADALRPSVAMTMKLGLRQLPLFDMPVNLLAGARSRSADQLAPIVAEALQVADSALPASRGQDPVEARRLVHRRAARLVVGALTALVMRDRGEAQGAEADLLESVFAKYPSTFEWTSGLTAGESELLRALVVQLGNGIDYRSLDPSILSYVYEQALVDEDDRNRLGIHYTPPSLAARILRDLPVELVPPDDRFVLDPACGSGTLLVAAHDRLRDLQPRTWPADQRHRDLAVHLRGFDIDPFAAEIARLALLLHAQPSGNGWQIEEVDALQRGQLSRPPRIIVTNPPWRYAADEHRSQVADAFVRWSMQALASGGLLGMLVPGSWLSSDNSSDSRQQLLAKFDVFDVWRLPEGTFANSRQPPSVVLARKRDGRGGRGGRVVSEVSVAELSNFMAGEPSAVRFLHTDDDVPLGAVTNAPSPTCPTVPLVELTEILSGPQPLPHVADRGEGVPYVNHFGSVRPYAAVSEGEIWHVHHPDDFQSARGARLIGRRKVLASAARSWSSPWRFRVAIDLVGVAVRNSVRCIAPLDEEDDDLLYAILIAVGSGFASTFAASIGGDRNIPARVLPSLPFPRRRADVRRLAQLGRESVRLSHDSVALNRHLIRAEIEVWDIYGVGESDRQAAIARLARHPAPEGAVRYEPLQSAVRQHSPSRLRRVGVVLGFESHAVRVWVNGVTPAEGSLVALPSRMPGWLARPGATFDVVGVDTPDDLREGWFALQPMAWRDIDLDSEIPAQLLPR